MDIDKLQEEHERNRWNRLKRESNKWSRLGLGAPVDLKDFGFLLCHGGEITETNTPYVDNYFIHRMEIKAEGRVYRFKILTDTIYDFSPP